MKAWLGAALVLSGCFGDPLPAHYPHVVVRSAAPACSGAGAVPVAPAVAGAKLLVRCPDRPPFEVTTKADGSAPIVMPFPEACTMHVEADGYRSLDVPANVCGSYASPHACRLGPVIELQAATVTSR